MIGRLLRAIAARVIGAECVYPDRALASVLEAAAEQGYTE